MPRKIATVLATAFVVLSVSLPSKAKAGCNTKACIKRVEYKRWKTTVRPYRAWIARTSRCESTGNWRANTGNGFYGGMQFTLSSWAAVGGRGFPHCATRLEQSYRSVLLRRKQGVGAWPVCGH